MTQAQLAAMLHVTDKAVSKWERGLCYPDVTLLEPLADAFCVSIGGLLRCRLSGNEGKEQPLAENEKDQSAQEKNESIRNVVKISEETAHKQRWKIAVLAKYSRVGLLL